MSIAVLGGAGFIGANLVKKLLLLGKNVVVYDDLSSGRKENLPANVSCETPPLERYELEGHSILPARVVYNLASPTGINRVLAMPIKTIMTNIMATKLALEAGQRVIQASAAAVYGEPTRHPQEERDRGNADLLYCYGEAKRCAEALCHAYSIERRVNVGVARLFNTYGSGMAIDDSRVVPTFICQALNNKPLTVYGEGRQTRAFTYVDDAVDGLIALADTDHFGPFNIGNPEEITILDLAETVIALTGSNSGIRFISPRLDIDVQRRCPDITKAQIELNWAPKVNLIDGLLRTIEYFDKELVRSSS